MNKEEVQQRILEIETAMQGPNFWADKARAQLVIKELQDLKADYDRGRISKQEYNQRRDRLLGK